MRDVLLDRAGRGLPLPNRRRSKLLEKLAEA